MLENREMSKGKIVILSGPSGSGKTTLHNKLLVSKRLKGRLVKSISVTTRPPRRGERDGRDYFFITQKQFLKQKRKGYFLEWQKVFGYYYGTPQENVRELLESGQNVLLCIDVKGAKVIRRKYPLAAKIFINAPAISVLKKRLEARGAEAGVELEKRLATAQKEALEAAHYDYVIINDDLSRAFEKLESIVLSALKED